MKVLLNSFHSNGHTTGFHPDLKFGTLLASNTGQNKTLLGQNDITLYYKPEDPNGHFFSAVFPNAAFPHHISSANALGHDVLMTKLKTHNTK